MPGKRPNRLFRTCHTITQQQNGSTNNKQKNEQPLKCEYIHVSFLNKTLSTFLLAWRLFGSRQLLKLFKERPFLQKKTTNQLDTAQCPNYTPQKRIFSIIFRSTYIGVLSTQKTREELGIEDSRRQQPEIENKCYRNVTASNFLRCSTFFQGISVLCHRLTICFIARTPSKIL